MVLSVRPPPPPAARGRSPAQLRDQHAALSLALRSALSDDDAAALMPTAACVRLPGRGPRRTDARFVGVVHAIVDALPKHLLLHLPAALARLSVQERLVLLLVVQQGHPKATAAEALGISVRTLSTRVDGALTRLACLLWDADGHAQAVPPRR